MSTPGMNTRSKKRAQRCTEDIPSNKIPKGSANDARIELAVRVSDAHRFKISLTPFHSSRIEAALQDIHKNPRVHTPYFRLLGEIQTQAIQYVQSAKTFVNEQDPILSHHDTLGSFVNPRQMENGDFILTMRLTRNVPLDPPGGSLNEEFPRDNVREIIVHEQCSEFLKLTLRKGIQSPNIVWDRMQRTVDYVIRKAFG